VAAVWCWPASHLQNRCVWRGRVARSERVECIGAEVELPRGAPSGERGRARVAGGRAGGSQGDTPSSAGWGRQQQLDKDTAVTERRPRTALAAWAAARTTAWKASEAKPGDGRARASAIMMRSHGAEGWLASSSSQQGSLLPWGLRRERLWRLGWRSERRRPRHRKPSRVAGVPGQVPQGRDHMAPRARWVASSSSQQRALLPWVSVGQIGTTFERAARRTECVL
jgi:hypothetical protein